MQDLDETALGTAVSALMTLHPDLTMEQAEAAARAAMPTAAKTYELPHVHELSDPFQLGSELKTAVTFRNRLCGGFMEHMTFGAQQKLGDFYPIIAKMTGETLDTIKKLGPQDLFECAGVVSSFFSRGKTPTGEISK